MSRIQVTERPEYDWGPCENCGHKHYDDDELKPGDCYEPMNGDLCGCPKGYMGSCLRCGFKPETWRWDDDGEHSCLRVLHDRVKTLEALVAKFDYVVR